MGSQSARGKIVLFRGVKKYDCSLIPLGKYINRQSCNQWLCGSEAPIKTPPEEASEGVNRLVI